MGDRTRMTMLAAVAVLAAMAIPGGEAYGQDAEPVELKSTADLAGAEPGSGPWTFAADAALVSKYVWRGQNVTNGLVMQPNVSVGYEGLSVSVLEAMMSGLPVVGTDIRGIREQVADGINGRLVPVGSVGALAEALDSLAREAGQRRDMGESSRAVALERYDVRSTASPCRGTVGDRGPAGRRTAGAARLTAVA